MAKNIRSIDPQGRIIMPVHIRKALNLNTGSVVEVDMEEDGTVCIRATENRCTFCGDTLEDKAHLTIGKDKHICVACAEKVAKAMAK